MILATNGAVAADENQIAAQKATAQDWKPDYPGK